MFVLLDINGIFKELTMIAAASSANCVVWGKPLSSSRTVCGGRATITDCMMHPKKLICHSSLSTNFSFGKK